MAKGRTASFCRGIATLSGVPLFRAGRRVIVNCECGQELYRLMKSTDNFILTIVMPVC